MKEFYRKRVLHYLNAENYIKYVSQLQSESKIWHIFLLLPRQIFRPQFEFIRDFTRIYKASRLRTDLIEEHDNLPDIEIFIACIAKDFDLLPNIITRAIQTSANRVRRITVATTADLVKSKVSVGSISVEFVDENSLIDEENRSSLRHRFGDRYGWVLQQLLTLTFVLRSSSPGILVINADTFLLRRQVWLDNNAVQPLMCSYEYNKPYYEFLSLFNFPVQNVKCSHITHHMLMQPDKMREIFEHHINMSFTEFISFIIEKAPAHNSPICVEFELYAYGMNSLYPQLIRKRKFANTSMPRVALTSNSFEFSDIQLKYNSISMHDYID
jgi:hypothetical protein